MNFSKLALAAVLLNGVLTASAAKNLSFNEALAQIIVRDTSIPSAQSNLEAAKISSFSKKMAFLPTLTAGKTLQKEHLSSTAATRHGHYLQSKINLLRFGGDYFAMNRSQQQYSKKKSALDQTYLKTERGAVKSLVAYIQKIKEVEILQKIVNVKKSSLKIARMRFKRGLTPSQEVDKSLVDLNNSKAQMGNSQILLDAARGDLVALLGHDQVQTNWPWKRMLNKISSDKLEEYSFNIQDLPQFQESNFSVAEQEYNVSQAKSNLLPTIDFSYTFNRNKAAGLKTNEQTSLLSITAPLFSGFSDYSDLSTRRALLNSARYQQTRIQRELLSQWESGKNSFRIGLETAKARDNNLVLSRRLYRDNFLRFQKGRITVNDLVLDQNRLFESENLSNQGWSSAHVAFVDYCHSLGKRLSSCLTLFN